MLNVFNISKHDTVGRRFNNLDAASNFSKWGWNATFGCWTPKGEPNEIVQQAHGVLNRRTSNLLAKVSYYTGNVNGYFSNADAFKRLSNYCISDLLHFHIVHESYLSIKDWLSLAKNKPVVWTWHDPYMLNGHCIYSLDCREFEQGCQHCDHLDYHFPINRDRCRENLEEKLLAVKIIDPLVIVASNYMYDLINRSVYRNKIRTRILNFGLEIPTTISQKEAKAKLSIPNQNIVVGFRAIHSVYKGMPLILDALKKFSQKYSNFPLTVIAFQETGFCNGLSPNFQIIETGWISDAQIHDYYAAMDYFLMPSAAEAFGLMAIEALANGACPIVTYNSGSALPELVAAPIHGISTAHSLDAYSYSVEHAILNATQNAKNRERRIKFAYESYNIDKFCRELSSIYDEEYEYYHSI